MRTSLKQRTFVLQFIALLEQKTSTDFPSNFFLQRYDHEASSPSAEENRIKWSWQEIAAKIPCLKSLIAQATRKEILKLQF